MVELPGKRKRVLDLFKAGGFAFVHVPKTAGFSMTCELLDGNITEHATATELRANIGEIEWAKLFTFAFVRDPATRFVSAFWYLKAGGMNKRDSNWARVALSRADSAEDFVGVLTEDNTGLAEWVHFRPQSHFLCDAGTGTLLVEFIGRFENLQDDYFYILRKIGLAARYLPRRNESDHHDELVGTWGATARRQLVELYHRDYELLGYPVP